MRRKRRSERDLVLPGIQDIARRRRCAGRPERFLPTYFPDTFYQAFTPQRLDILKAIRRAAEIGGDQAIAASRGEGKTALTECEIIELLIEGIVSFPLICAATGPDAERILTNIKLQFETNDLLMADFPEICHPIRSLEGAPQRANMQTVDGVRTLLKWGASLVVFPTVLMTVCQACGSNQTERIEPGRSKAKRPPTHVCSDCRGKFRVEASPISGSVLMTRGLDAAIRGIRYGTKRPDVVVIDDPETRESADSELQCADRRTKIEEDIGGLGGPGKRMARLMLTTCMNRHCVSWEYTDPTTKPSWQGVRYRFLIKPPGRLDLWDEYIGLRQDALESGDATAREAHRFYLKRRKRMDAGAEVSNPDRFVAAKLGDGSQLEVSALQHYYNLVADRGEKAVLTELDNAPPADDEPVELGITSKQVRESLNGLERKTVPDDTAWLTAMIDVGRQRLHYVVKAWNAEGAGRTIDYGVQDVHQADVVGDEAAIRGALDELGDDWDADPYGFDDGTACEFDCCLVDCGYQGNVKKRKHSYDRVVYAFVRTRGKPWRASRGVANFKMPTTRTKDRKRGKGGQWYQSKQGPGLWVINFAPDWWKHLVHDRWRMDAAEPSAFTVFGDRPAPHRHAKFDEQVAAEVFIEEWVEGEGKRQGFRIRPGQKHNHYFDGEVGASVAAAVAGLNFDGGRQRARRSPATKSRAAGKRKRFRMVGPYRPPHVGVK